MPAKESHLEQSSAVQWNQRQKVEDVDDQEPLGSPDEEIAHCGNMLEVREDGQAQPEHDSGYRPRQQDHASLPAWRVLLPPRSGGTEERDEEDLRVGIAVRAHRSPVAELVQAENQYDRDQYRGRKTELGGDNEERQTETKDQPRIDLFLVLAQMPLHLVKKLSVFRYCRFDVAFQHFVFSHGQIVALANGNDGSLNASKESVGEAASIVLAVVEAWVPRFTL